MKTIIERGASWTLEETKLLLSLWGQDMITRQATGQKRTKEVYDKISLTFREQGYERTAEQVRTRVFNMIAEYRRILKDATPERMKKCIFFEPLHKIYKAKHIDDVKSALDDYEPDNPYSPPSREESTSDTETIDDSIINNNRVNESISQTNDNSNAPPPPQPPSASSQKQPAASESASSTQTPAKKPRLDSPKAGTSSEPTPDVAKHKSNPVTVPNSIAAKQQQSLLLGGGASASANKASGSTPTYINVTPSLKNGTPNGTATATRMPANAVTGHQFYSAPMSTFDVTSTALLIDRMFSHLSRESENMREWIALEKDRIQLERARRVQETERDCRRERVLIDTLIKFQEQWISFIKSIEPEVIERRAASMPGLKFPSKEPFTEPDAPAGGKGKSLLSDHFNDIGESDASGPTLDYTRNSTPTGSTSASTPNVNTTGATPASTTSASTLTQTATPTASKTATSTVGSNVKEETLSSFTELT